MMPRRPPTSPVEETNAIAETMEKLPAFTTFLNQRLENVKVQYEALAMAGHNVAPIERRRRMHGIWETARNLYTDCKALARRRNLYTELTTHVDARMKAVQKSLAKATVTKRNATKLRAFMEEMTVFLEQARLLLSVFPPEQDVGEIVWANAVAEARFVLAHRAQQEAKDVVRPK